MRGFSLCLFHLGLYEMVYQLLLTTSLSEKRINAEPQTAYSLFHDTFSTLAVTAAGAASLLLFTTKQLRF